MPIRGKIEIFNRRTVSGWIVNVEPLSEPILVEILIDGKVIAQAEASGFREDVAKLNFCDGNCNFTITLPDALLEEDYERARLRISGSDIYLELPRKNNETGPIISSQHSRVSTPVFIVGSPRSGTSILVQALFSVGYNGFEEGNLLGLSKSIDDTINEYFLSNDHDRASTLIGNVAIEELHNNFFEAMKRQIEKLNPISPWLDKTGNPETIQILPRIMKAWPSAKVIFAKRRGIENIISRIRKFPERDFRYHCEDWVRNMRSWREVRPNLDQQRIIEVDQYNIAQASAAVSEKLAALLNLNADERLKMQHTFERDRPQLSSGDSFQKRISLGETGWTQESQDMFVEICGMEMKEYGYEIN